MKTVKDSRDDFKHRATAINEGKRAGGKRRSKPNTDGRKALKKYKTALKTELLFGSKAVCTEQEKQRLASAGETI